MNHFKSKAINFFRLKSSGFWDLAIYIFKIELIIVLFIEFLNWHIIRGRFLYAPLIFLQAILLGTPIAVMLTSFFLFISNRILFSILSSTTLLLILLSIHALKTKYLNFPLYLADYILLQEGAEVLSWLLNSPVTYALVLTGSFFLGWAVLKITRASIVKTKRIFSGTIFLASATFVFVAFQFKTVNFEELYPKENLRNSSLGKSGFLPFFVMTFRHLDTHAPENYNPKSIQAIVQRYPESQTSAPSQDQVKPDIIFYILESLMDYASYGIRFAEEPMPFFKKLRAETGHSVFLSSAFGGNTIKPEFSLMTGLLALHHPNPMVFLTSTNQTFPSLCEALHSAGYLCLGMHTGTSYFFQRQSAYKRLNFDLFEGLQTLLTEPNLARVPGGHLADDVLVERFLEKLNGDPTFAHLLTISTHAEYSEWNLDPRFAVVEPKLPKNLRQQLQRYAAAVHQADLAFEKLVLGLRKKQRPFILFAYGDHAPGLFQVFDALAFTKKKAWERKEKYKTPMIMLSNLPEHPAPKGITVSPNLVISIIETFTGPIPKLPLQFRIAKEIHKYWDAFSTVMIENKNAPDDGLKKEQLLKDYALIQYDLVHGKRYSLKEKTIH